MSMGEDPTPREVGPRRFLIFCYVKHTQEGLLLDRLRSGDAYEETDVRQAIVQRWTRMMRDEARMLPMDELRGDLKKMRLNIMLVLHRSRMGDT